MLSHLVQAGRRPTRHVGLVGRPLLRPQVRTSWVLQAGDDKSGHIKTGPNEGVLFFNNLYPLWVQWALSWRTSITTNLPDFADVSASPVKIFKKAQANLPSDGVSATALEVLPRLKEGGAFLKFRHEEGASRESVHATVSQYLKDKHIRAWKVGLVYGQPWVEDLRRVPSARLRVEFLPTGPGQSVTDLSQEQLYAYFRPYGKLVDIVPQPADNKTVPRYAHVDFAKTKKCIVARNCLHGLLVDEAHGGGETGTVLRLTYEKKERNRWFWDWMSSHPRIVLPIAAALIAGITVTIFDPIRTFSIKSHITHAFHIDNNKAFKWFKAQSKELVSRLHLSSRGDDGAGMLTIMQDRKDSIEQIQTWLLESVDTFIVVQGPRGSGEKELLDKAIGNRKHTLVIDCKPIQEARGDGQTIAAAAQSVGYWPVFSWMNSMNGLFDLAAQGATGIKTGFSETLENQLLKILTNTAQALKMIALEERSKKDRDASLSDDEYLEAHPERRPVVVLDNFLYKNQEGAVIYDKLAEWGASLSSSNTAHVIFVTHDVSFNKALSKALPDRVFRVVSLSDCTEEVAKEFVLKHLEPEALDAEVGFLDPTPSQRRKDLAELDDVLPNFGGRLTDLEFLARRVKAGEAPSKAEAEIVSQSVNEIMKMFLLAPTGGGPEGKAFKAVQAWALIKQLAKCDRLRYNEVAIGAEFAGGQEKALSALEEADLISIVTQSGRPHAIIPGRPIYAAAFRKIVEDQVLASKLDLAVMADKIKGETATIDKLEQELKLLGDLPKQPPELNDRVKWLLTKVSSSQATIEATEKESARLKDILKRDF